MTSEESSVTPAPTLIAFRRSNRSCEAAAAAEEISAAVAPTGFWSLSMDEPLEDTALALRLTDDSLEILPAFAAIAANSALTDAAVSSGIVTFKSSPFSLFFRCVVSILVLLLSTLTPSAESMDADETVRKMVTLSQSTFPSSSTPAPRWIGYGMITSLSMLSLLLR